MRTFYIFKVNKEYYKLTKNIPFNLYSAYLNIRMSTKDNIKYLYNEYFSFTERFNSKIINNTLYNKMNKLDGYSIYNNIHQYTNYYTDEVSKLTIYNSYMVLKSNVNNSSFFKELINIPNLFIIDFDAEDYFWLSSLKNLRVVNECQFSV